MRLALQAPQGLDHAPRFLVAGAGQRLVEKQQLRRGRKRDGEFELAFLAVGQEARAGYARARRARPASRQSMAGSFRAVSREALPKKRKLEPERA